MSKISTYDVAPVPKLADKLIGTSVGGTPDDGTYNFTLQELLTLFLPNIPANNLQGILDYGNTATQDINLTGTIYTTDLDVSGTATILDSFLTGDTHISGGLFDVNVSIGTAGQVLTSTGTQVEWYTIPTVIPDLQQVLTAGNISTVDIILTSNLSALDVSSDTGTFSTDITIDGTLTDGTASVGTAGKVLSSTGTGVQWVSLPVYSATSPLFFNSGTGVFSIQVANGTQDGYLTSADWITFDGKQNAGNYITSLTGEASGSGPGAASVTLNNASVIAKVLTGLNVTGGTVLATDSILTGFGKVQNQINGLIGGSIFQGVWNATTNSPVLASGVGTNGYYYIVSVAGSTNLDGITDWQVGDWAIFAGTSWQKVDNTDAVSSVNGFTGAVSLTTDNIPEGATNLYFTNTRARTAISLTTTGSSGASTYDNTTGVFNIPNYGLASPLTTKGDLYTFSTVNTRLPIGLDTQVLIADSTQTTGLKWGTNTAATPLGYYGAFSDVTDQFASVINTGYPMLLGITDLSNGVTVVSGSRVTIANTGIYNIQWSAQFRNPTAIVHDVTIWLRKNGVDVPGSSGVVAVTEKHGSFDGHVLPSWNFLLDAVAGDYYEFVWSTESVSVFISFQPAGNPPPSTASVVLTVTQQSGIMAGTGITAINSLTGASQTLTVGSTGTDFAIVDSGVDHKFNLPSASATARGVVTTETQTFAGAKTFTSTLTATAANFSSIIPLVFSSATNIDFHQLNSGTIRFIDNTAANVNLSVTNSGNLTARGTATVGSIGALGSSATTFLTHTAGLIQSRTAAEVRSDIGAGTGSGTVTSVAAITLGTSGTDLSSTVATGTTTPVITLNVPTASAANRGALSSTDWSTFNGKQAALNGTGFVKISGTTISYDNSTYLTTATAASTYVPYTGATGNINLGTNNGITLTDTGLNSSISITSSSTGSGAIVIDKNTSGEGIRVNNNGIGFGVYANNASTGSGIAIGNFSTGKGLYIDNAAAATGDPFVYTLNGSGNVKAKIDYLGNITGTTATFNTTTSGSAAVSGLNIIPSTSSQYVALQTGLARFIGRTSTTDTYWTSNTDLYTATITGGSSYIGQNAGVFSFYSATSVSAGATPSFVERFSINTVGAATFTGALSGTSATFSGNTTSTSIANITGTDGGGKQLRFIGGVTTYNGLIAVQENYANTLEITASSAVGTTTFNRNIAKFNLSDLSTTFSGALTGTSATFSGYITFDTTDRGIITNTTDGSDNKFVSINGGGARGSDRGAGINLFGNEASGTGRIDVNAGDVTGGVINLVTAGLNRLTVARDGNVGIGTTTPNYAGLTGKIATVNSTTGNYGGYEVAYNGVSNGAFITNGSQTVVGTRGAFPLVFETNLTTALTIATNQAATFASSVTATAYYTSSDIRLKNVLSRTLTEDFNTISYNWKDKEKDTKIHYGYSAQEVAKVLPDLVSEDSNGHLSVNYTEALVYKIMKLEERIKQLESR